MKKFVFLIAAITMMSCSQQEMKKSVPPTTADLKTKLGIRSYDDALAIARNAIGRLENKKSISRGINSSRKVDLTENKAIVRNNDNNDTLIYVFNFENHKGFALVSAIEETDGLLAVTEQGHYDPDSSSETSGFDIFINQAKKYVLNGGRVLRSPEIIIDSVVTQHFYIYPLLTVEWGQENPEGEFCENNISGCGPTAFAQIMSYYESPSSFVPTYLGNGAGTISLQWTAMKNHNKHNGGASSCPSGSSVHQSIAHLCRQIGYLSDSDYETGYTGTNIYDLLTAIDSFSYVRNNWIDFTNQDLRNFLLSSHPILMVGLTGLTPEDTGHFWIVDGVDREATTTYLRRYDQSYQTWYQYMLETTNDYFHINWGWDGENNGYFLNHVFDTTSPEYYDHPAGSNNNNYNFNTAIKFLIAYPKDPNEEQK